MDEPTNDPIVKNDTLPEFDTREERLQEYVTVGREFTIFGDTEVLDGHRKVGEFGGFTIYSDEMPTLLGGGGTAPRPLDYFCAGTAF